MKVTKVIEDNGNSYSHKKKECGVLINTKEGKTDKGIETYKEETKSYINGLGKDDVEKSRLYKKEVLDKHLKSLKGKDKKEKEERIYENKKRKIEKSIVNNKIYFKLEGGEVKLLPKEDGSLSRQQWFMSLFDVDAISNQKDIIKEDKLEEYEEFYFGNSEDVYFLDLKKDEVKKIVKFKEVIKAYESKILFKYFKKEGLNFKAESEEYKPTVNYAYLLKKYMELKGANAEISEEQKSKFDTINTQDKEILEKLDIQKCKELNDKLNEYLFYMTEVKKYLEKLYTINRQGKLKENKLKIIYVKKAVRLQIKNKVVQSIINQGKALAYYGNEDIIITSEHLEDIKIKETLKKKFIDTAYTANSKFRTIINYNGDKDVLEKILKFKTSAKEDREEIFLNKEEMEDILKRIKEIYNIEDDLEVDDIHNLILYIQKVANYTRNRAVHIDENKTYTNEINLSKFFYDKSNNNNNVNDSINCMKKSYNKDLDELEKIFKIKVESMGILAYYDVDTLNKIFKGITFELKDSNIPFRPTFKKVFIKGQNKGKDKNREEIYKIYKKYDDKEKMIAYSNLLQLIYNNSFLNYTTTDDGKELLNTSIDEIIRNNDEISKSNKYISKYTQFEIIKNNTNDIDEFFKSLQSEIMKSENGGTKEERKNNNNSTEKEKVLTKYKNKYRDFLQEVFTYAFDKYIDSKNIIDELSKIADEKQNVTTDMKDELNIKIKSGITKDDEENISAYVYFKLLNNNVLSELKNNLVKYSVYENQKGIDENKENIEKYICIINLIILTKSMNDFSRDKNINDVLSDDYENILKRFVNADCINDSFYKENGNIKFKKNLIKLNKIGTTEVYETMFNNINNFKVSKSDIDNFNDASEEIKEYQEKVKKLHEQLCKNKRFDKNKLEEYKKAQNKVKEYNELNAKVNFNNIIKINELNIEIISRVNGFYTDLERDEEFIKKYLNSLGMFTELIDILSKFADIDKVDLVTYDEACNILNEPRLTPSDNLSKRKKKKIREELKIEQDKKIYNKFIKNNISYKDRTDIRNYVAHFQHYSSPKMSLIDLINDTYKIMSYDLKRKNAVTKSIIDICNKKHINLVLTKNDEFKLNNLSSYEVEYLKNLKKNSVKQKMYSDMYIEMVKQMFEYKNNSHTR